MFVRPFYASQPELRRKPYAEQMAVLYDTYFGISNFYERHLHEDGHEAMTVVANCRPAQYAWAAEHGLRVMPDLVAFKRQWQGRVPFVKRSTRKLLSILVQQARAYKPDVVLILDVAWLPREIVAQLGSATSLLIGQHASPLPTDDRLREYDALLSSLPHYVEHFKRQGKTAAYLRLAFEPDVVGRLSEGPPEYDVSHIGGYAIHGDRVQLLTAIAAEVPLDLWGYRSERLPPNSPIRQRCHGEVWGLAMHDIRHRSRICLNRHATWADGYANNLSLYEITAVGSCLLTDDKPNMADLFEPDREAVTYSSADECVEKARYLLDHEGERQAIAHAGRERLLREHTFRHRTDELLALVKPWLDGKASR